MTRDEQFHEYERFLKQFVVRAGSEALPSLQRAISTGRFASMMM